MRRLAEFDDKSLAFGLAHQLQKHGIECQSLDEESPFVVWVLDDDQLPRARGILAQFQQSPRPQTEPPKHKEPAATSQVRQVRTDVWQSSSGLRRQATVSILLFCILVYLGQQGGLPSGLIEKFYIALPGTGPFANILAGEVWRLVTPIFLHFSLLHILFNMLWFYQLGIMIETISGPRKLILLMVVSGIFSNALQYIQAGANFGGMSGVIYCFLTYAWAKGRWQPESAYYIDKGTFGFMIVWLVLCFVGAFGPVANFAHLGGFIAGLAWARIEWIRERNP